MKKWRITAVVTGSKYLGTYEAETKEEAEDMAAGEMGISLCYQCSDQCEDAEVMDVVTEEVE